MRMRKRTERTKRDFHCLICRSAIGRAGFWINIAMLSFPNLRAKHLIKKLTNRQQFFMVCTLIDHRNDVKMFKTQEEPPAAGEWFHCKVFDPFVFLQLYWEFLTSIPLKFLGKSRARKKEKEWRTYHFISMVCTLIDHAARNHSDIVKIKIWSIIYKLCVNNLASGKLGDGIQGKERITCQRSRFCLVPRRLSLDVNFREVPACVSSPVTCVSRSPLFKTKVRNSTRLQEETGLQSGFFKINVLILFSPLLNTPTLNVHPSPMNVFMFGERTLLLVTHLVNSDFLRKSVFLSAKRTNTPSPPHPPPPKGTEKAEPRESFLAVLILKLQRR